MTFLGKHLNIRQALSRWGGTATPEVTCTVPSQGCIIGIGHSHVMSWVYAQQARVESGRPIATHLHWILLQDEEFQPNVVSSGGRMVLNAAVRRRLDKELASLRETPPFLCTSISGNEYFYVGLTEHPRPFDFSLPGRPDLEVRSGVQIIAPSLMQKTLERSIEHSLSIMSALRAATDLPIVFVQSPPPMPSNDFIREHPGPFREAIEENGVAPASLRMKFWLLQSAIYRQRSDELGFRYLGIPEETVDAAGFLQEVGSWPDSVHANPWYGEFVLRQIESLFRRQQAAEVTR